MKRSKCCITALAALLMSFSACVDLYASDFQLMDMDIVFWNNTDIWDLFSDDVRNNYIIARYLDNIQDWYGIPEEERLIPEDIIVYERSFNADYNNAHAFCNYPDDKHIYLNREKFSDSSKYLPGDLHAIGVLAHEICHIVQMREKRARVDETTMKLQDIEASTNAANYLYFLTEEPYAFNNYRAVTTVHVHTY